MEPGHISKLTLQRLPAYLSYLRSLPEDAGLHISATAIADGLGLGEVQVRKDLAAVTSCGKPKTGYPMQTLVRDLERFLGAGGCSRTVLVGVGNLGLALLSYGGFSDYGLRIMAAFDVNPALVGATVDGHPILPASQLPAFCRQQQVQIGILAVPAAAAQGCCDALTRSGVQAVWNFAPVRLRAPEGVLIQQEDMACSLALLSHHLKNSCKLADGPNDPAAAAAAKS